MSSGNSSLDDVGNIVCKKRTKRRKTRGGTQISDGWMDERYFYIQSRSRALLLASMDGIGEFVGVK
jgi:hypothetical protein